MSIKAFIFDLDGVITDTAEFHYLAWQRLADEEGLPFTRAENEALRGLSRRESLMRLLKGKPVDEATAEMWMTRKNDYYQTYLEQITPDDRLAGVTAFLDAARAAGLKLAIGSSSRNARAVLAKLALLDTFSVIADGYSVVNAKPAPDLFVWAAGGLGIAVNEAVVFEDAEAGVEAALAGGFPVVGLGSTLVARAHLVVPDLSQLTVEAVLTHFADDRSTP